MIINTHLEGGYRFIPAVSQYSAGVAAEPNFAIHRVQLQRVVPLAEGFELIRGHLQALERPLSAFCACELRSPAPFSEAGFRAFNEHYLETLQAWNILLDGVNPVARSNLCPAWAPPAEPGLHAFSYTMPTPGEASSFVISGSGETKEGMASYAEHIVARGDTSLAGLRSKVAFVLSEMQRRMHLLGFDWPDVTAVQVYSVHDLHPLLEELFGPLGVLGKGLSWHYNRPPILELEYEMDCRGVFQEQFLALP